jgi:hypothetical protein
MSKRLKNTESDSINQKLITIFFFLLLSSFDSALVDIPCIVSGIGSILLFFPLTYTAAKKATIPAG